MFSIKPDCYDKLGKNLTGIALERDSDSFEAPVGDLEGVLCAALEIMTPEQVAKLAATEPVQFLLGEAAGMGKEWVTSDDKA